MFPKTVIPREVEKMLEMCTQERVCPSCKGSFFPEEKVVHKTLCGEDLVCSPPGEGYKAPDCKTYDFCSEKCLEEYESKLPTCGVVPGWKRYFGRINKVGSSSGIAGARPHQLRKYGK